MTTLIHTGGALGDRRCDARCHTAASPRCDCVCNGRYHGAARTPGELERRLRETTEDFCRALRADGSAEALSLLDRIRNAQANAKQLPLLT